MGFEFSTAGRIIFGRGTRLQIPALVRERARRALLVHGSQPARVLWLAESLREQDVQLSTFAVSGEPSIRTALAGVELARSEGCEAVVGCGGGSVLDVGKAIAALLTNGGSPLDYLEVIGLGRSITQPAAPYLAIPTTAGTGAEVTRNAVLASPEHRVKVSMRSPLMLPSVALVDPELTHSVPSAVTASTGLDALAQVLEPYVSCQANPLADPYCREGMRRAARGLARAFRDGQDAEAREDMAMASLMGGLALANAKLGAAHGFAGPIGGMFPAPHGMICARLLPLVMEANIAALQARAPGSPALQRYDEVARILTHDATASASQGIAWLQALCGELAVPGLGSFGLGPDDVAAVVEKSARSSSMKGNPIVLSDQELSEVLTRALSP